MKVSPILHVAINAATLILSLSTSYALATQPEQAAPMDMSQGNMSMPQTSIADSQSTEAYKQNAQNMMQAMHSKPFTGDPDADFVAHMIPHHQGAVDQAKVELQYGRDPQMKALAKEIIQSQPQEIETMRQWQSKHAAQ